MGPFRVKSLFSSECCCPLRASAWTQAHITLQCVCVGVRACVNVSLTMYMRYMSGAIRAFMPYTLSVLRAFMPYTLSALRAFMPYMLSALRAIQWTWQKYLMRSYIFNLLLMTQKCLPIPIDKNPSPEPLGFIPHKFYSRFTFKSLSISSHPQQLR